MFGSSAERKTVEETCKETFEQQTIPLQTPLFVCHSPATFSLPTHPILTLQRTLLFVAFSLVPCVSSSSAASSVTSRCIPVRVYVTYVFYLWPRVCVLCEAGGCLRSAPFAAAEEIKWGCVSWQCCKFISLLTALILLPIHKPPLDPHSFSLSLPLAKGPASLSLSLSVRALETINLPRCSIKLLRA